LLFFGEVDVSYLIAIFWGLGAILLLLGSAIYRLGLISLDMFSYPMGWLHWLALFVSLVFMGFSEGYRGFQKGFSPRVASRIYYLAQNPTPLRLLLAPAFCLGLFDVERKRQMITLTLMVAIVLVVQVVHLMPQPWRGIIDAGVVLGLGWGVITLLIFTVSAFVSREFEHVPEMPDTVR